MKSVMRIFIARAEYRGISGDRKAFIHVMIFIDYINEESVMFILLALNNIRWKNILSVSDVGA